MWVGVARFLLRDQIDSVSNQTLNIYGTEGNIENFDKSLIEFE